MLWQSTQAESSVISLGSGSPVFILRPLAHIVWPKYCLLLHPITGYRAGRAAGVYTVHIDAFLGHESLYFVGSIALANMFTLKFAAVGYSHRISDPRRTRIDSPSKSSYLTTKLYPSLKHTPRITLVQTLQANHWHWASRQSS